MVNYIANPEKILYIGRWENNETSKECIGDFGKAIFMFKGERIKIDAEGEIYCSLDGDVAVPEKEFTTAYGIHTMFITAMAEAVLHSVETEEILNVDVYLRAKMREEFAEIENGRELIRDTSNYKRLEYKAKLPSGGVKLGGLFGELFERGVERVKLCAKYPYHLAGYATKGDNVSKGWVKWLPGATDGRILAGAAKSYLWTHDEELRAIVDRVVDNIAEHTLENGYSNYNPEEKAYGNKYVPNAKNELQTLMDSELKNFDRIFWTYGMVAAGEAGSEKAFGLVRDMYDWLENSPYKNTLVYGHNATNALTGNLILAQSAAGRMSDVFFHQRYLDQRFLEEEFKNRNPFAFSNYPADRPHCYVLVNVYAAMLEYTLTGDSHYLDVVLGAWDIYKNYYKHIGGTTAICESDGPYLPGSYLLGSSHTGETCGSVFWVWINSELAQHFPDEAKYSAEIEEVLFNVVPTIITPRGDVRYHNRLEGTKDPGESVGTCCEIMTTHIYADLPKYVFSYSSDCIWVNQYITAQFNTGDMSVATDADIFDEHKLTVTVKKAADKQIRVRIPDWADDAKIYVNGSFIRDAAKGTFESIERKWADGDTITVTFTPARKVLCYTGAEQLKGANPIPNGDPRYAFVYGPSLMALTGEYTEAVPTIDIDPTTLEIEANGKNSATVTVDDKLKFVPYADIDEEKFCVFPAYNLKERTVAFNTAGTT